MCLCGRSNGLADNYGLGTARSNDPNDFAWIETTHKTRTGACVFIRHSNSRHLNGVASLKSIETSLDPKIQPVSHFEPCPNEVPEGPTG